MSRDDADLDLLGDVARGVIELASTTRASAFRLPYPVGLQLAVDRLVMAALTRSLVVPAGVPDLLSWCGARPLADWPITLPDSFLTADARLVQPTAGEPTLTCAQLASHGPRGTLEQDACSRLAALADTCHTPERFAVCRDFLISRPVILRVDPAELLLPAVAQTWKLVKELYQPVPDRFHDDGLVHRCTRCGLLARSTTAVGPWCEGGCPPSDRTFESTSRPEQALALPLALRLFLALPGRTELAVRRELGRFVRPLITDLGVHWVDDRNGGSRPFLVQDLEQPVLAALRAREAAARLGTPLNVVVPDGRAARTGYRRDFARSLGADAGVRLSSAAEFTTSRPTRDTEENDA
ncbi:pPIWI_RE_Y domain-containing protein [Streptomyces johnsoniae]|uniref:pPIWI-RE three-gene island domain-containing protein n=1 Tax=Streptomyces johnsoniae TaxID=3075532 RepID=A0ABU2SDJ1_9ACTN|nr:hypothetical protein [Streptomyces sp. DSM 41886]MDT0447042.1 hypothetical protein [Streptomyces sp. DSM 41886]